jgi:hypothetical protein
MKKTYNYYTFIALILFVSSSFAQDPSSGRQLSNPNSSPEAEALYCYMKSQFGEKTFSGQMWAPWGIDEIATVYNLTGKYPAMRGQDLITENQNNNEVRLATEWWEAGGIPTVMWHWGAPGIGEGYENSKGTIDIDRCFQVGTAEYNAMWSDLERIADHLTTLRDANVPILWRPMHECDGGWFWYGKEGGAQFIRLWQTMYNYFVNDRGLNNLIWVLCYSGEVKDGWDPGDQYYDIAGSDSYGTGIQANMYNRLTNIHGAEIVKPYHECGTIPNPDDCFAQGITWSWWMLWHTGHLTDHNVNDLNAAYNHDLVITRDEIPDIMSFCGNPVCTATPIASFIQVDGGAWQETANITVATGSEIALGPHPTNIETGWTWSGNGISATTREITITATQSTTLTVTFTNDCGEVSSQQINITVNDNPQPSIGFTTNNTTGDLIDANGNNFIMKGMNVPLAWFVGNVNNNIANVRTNTNSNCLRIVVSETSNDADWQNTVQLCIDNDIIPMVELHSVTGSTSQADLVRMGQFWADRADYFTQPDIARYILINIANEWGTWQTANTNGVAWRDASIDAIEVMRNAGIKTTIVVDAVGYGQDIDDAKNIRAYATDIQDADAGFLNDDANLLFSVHMYCEWRIGGDNIGIIGTIKDMGVPMIVGEFGYQHATDGSCDIDEQAILNTCQTEGIGWLAWSQKGNGSPVEYLDLCNDWACSDLSNWGNTIVNGTNGTETAITCSVFSPNNDPTPTVTITTPADASAICIGSSVSIAANANISSGSIAKVDFYDGATLLNTDNMAPYEYTWNSPDEGDHTIRAIATSAANMVSLTATSTLSVLAPVTIVPNSQINTAGWLNMPEITIAAGQDLSLGPWYDATTGWSWTGPNGFTADTRELFFTPVTEDENGIFTVTYTNAGGCISSVEYDVTVQATQTIVLQEGWNLISFYVHPTDSSIATLFNGLDVQEIKNMDSFWLKGQPDVFNSLNTITPGNGYLVNMNIAGTLTVTGTTVETPNLGVSTITGWNLIGCPFQTPTPFTSDFNSTNCQLIKNFEGFWIPNETANSIENTEPGSAYYLYK